MKFIEFLDNGCYPGSVCFIVGESYKDARKKLKDRWRKAIKYEDDKFENGFYCLNREFIKGDEKQTYVYIIIDKFDFSDYNMCKLAHEIVHLCQFYLPNFLNRDKEIEAEAYYHTHIMNQCLEKLRKHERLLHKS